MVVGIAPVGVAVVLMLLLASGSAAAAPKPISGKLNRSGYTVIALGANGRATSVRARRGTFALRPPATVVTLQLRAANGLYAGPIVVGVERRGKRAVMGVRAGAKLGKIDVNIRGGYAKVKRSPAMKWVDRKRWAQATKGAPVGAGRFGFVRSCRACGPSIDSDADGIPNRLDIDDNGNLILDSLDRSSTARSAQAAEQFNIHSSIGEQVDQTVNANALTTTPAKLDEALKNFAGLAMDIMPSDTPPELDCGQPQSRTDPSVGGLIYCTKGGTGRLFKPGVSVDQLPRFPDAFDPDGDGFGTMTPVSSQPAPGSGLLSMALHHGATSKQIGTGDLLIQRVRRGGVEVQFPATLQFVFATVPALVSYSDGAGDSTTVPYPVAGPAGPGTQGNPFPVAAGPGGDVILTLTFWRPQRERIAGDPKPKPGESGQWTDIGRLNYTVAVGTPPFCPSSTYSTTDPNLTSQTSPKVNPGFADTAPDRPASPAHTLTYTLNATQCLAAHGLTWNPGEQRDFAFVGVTGTGADMTQQNISFKRR